ncbi:MAG: hypothetical protein R3257_02735 [bacterium]|nr:hypothetical protein [bacterium]
MIPFDYQEILSECFPNRGEMGRVLSLEEFRNKTVSQQKERQKAQVRALQILEVIQGICRDYEAHMLGLAHERSREEWLEATGNDPYAQIEYDLVRLTRLVDSLKGSIEADRAATLVEAWEALEERADEELAATLNYVWSSDYFGFQCIRGLVSLGDLTDGQYREDAESLKSIEEDLLDGNYVFSIHPMRACAERREALAS